MRTILVAAAAALLVGTATAQIAAHRVTELPDYGQIESDTYMGYINMTTERKTFYAFSESLRDPATDPLVVWLTGGPGCSSLLAWSTEQGPYTIRLGENFVKNPYAWNNIANVLFIESPAGVGFSTDSVPPQVWNDTKTAAANYEFLLKWVAAYPKFAKHKLFLTGESYAGFYIPELANQIFEGQVEGSEALRAQMQGFMVGNPCTGKIGCANPDPTLEPFLQYNGFRPLNASIPVKANAPTAYNYDPYDLLEPTCTSASVAAQIRFPHPVADAFKQRHMAKVGAPAPYGACAQEFATAWFNRADVKAAIHADADITWEMCSNKLQYQINTVGVEDIYQRLMDKTTWKIMVYSGLDDSIVNQAQTQTILNGFGRTIKTNQWQSWNLPYWEGPGEQLGGFWVEWDRMSWAGVRNSGHMVPMYNPPAAFELFKSYIQLGRPGRM